MCPQRKKSRNSLDYPTNNTERRVHKMRKTRHPILSHPIGTDSHIFNQISEFQIAFLCYIVHQQMVLQRAHQKNSGDVPYSPSQSPHSNGTKWREENPIPYNICLHPSTTSIILKGLIANLNTTTILWSLEVYDSCWHHLYKIIGTPSLHPPPRKREN